MNGGPGFVVGQNDRNESRGLEGNGGFFDGGWIRYMDIREKGETRRLWSETRSGFVFLFSSKLLPPSAMFVVSKIRVG